VGVTITTFQWSASDGLYESWWPQKDRYEGAGTRRQVDGKATTESCVKAGGRKRGDKNRPTSGWPR